MVDIWEKDVHKKMWTMWISKNPNIYFVHFVWLTIISLFSTS